MPTCLPIPLAPRTNPYCFSWLPWLCLYFYHLLIKGIPVSPTMSLSLCTAIFCSHPTLSPSLPLHQHCSSQGLCTSCLDTALYPLTHTAPAGTFQRSLM